MRAETGTMCFENDYPGIFIRGDNANYYSFLLKQFLENKKIEDEAEKIIVKELAGLLGSCDVRIENNKIQNLKSFEKCKNIQ